MVFLLHVCFLYAVIDITRMVVLHPNGAIALQKHFESEKGISISIILLEHNIMTIICLIPSLQYETLFLL
jgi:hypothetical protein